MCEVWRLLYCAGWDGEGLGRVAACRRFNILRRILGGFKRLVLAAFSR